jgi:hypothetical protein
LVRSFLLVLLTLLASACALARAPQPASPPLARSVPHRPIALHVKAPTVVALRPPISFGRGMTPDGDQAWDAYWVAAA